MILACQNISKAFGTDEILKNVSFHIEENEKAAIVGINGAGKSTLLKIIMKQEQADEGEVIPEDDLPFIFDRFHKSDRSRSLDRDGVGLGLYLVKSILDAHDEDIVCTSKDGVTKFVFSLKLSRRPKPNYQANKS